MTEDEKEKLLAWAANWKETGEFLENLRREKIKNADTVQSMQILDAAYRSAVRNRAADTKTSGLVEFQRLMKRLKVDD